LYFSQLQIQKVIIQEEIRKIVLIGAGNVASHLGMVLLDAGCTILQVWSHSRETAAKLAENLGSSICDSLSELDQDADLYIISIPDHAIDKVLDQIKLKSEQLLVHTSGSLPMSVLKNKTANFGVFYPLQTFSKERSLDFTNIPLLLEASSVKNLYRLFDLAVKLSGSVISIDSDQRKRMHLAAVFASNFPNFLYTIAEEILADNKIEFDLLKPLILETAAKIITASPDDVQTGPAIRDDKKTIAEHMHMLQNYPEYGEIYELLSKLIRKRGL